MKKFYTPPSEYFNWKVGDKIIAMHVAHDSMHGPRLNWWRQYEIGVIVQMDYTRIDSLILVRFENSRREPIDLTVNLEVNKFMLYDDYINIQKNIKLIESL